MILQHLQHRDHLQSSTLVSVDLHGLIRAQSFLCCPTFQVFASDYVVSLLLSDNYTAQPSEEASHNQAQALLIKQTRKKKGLVVLSISCSLNAHAEPIVSAD